MVNKGYRNKGAQVIGKNLVLSGVEGFKVPLGISIGMSNNKSINNTSEAIKDIINTFKIFEKMKVKNSYYELNISCPNLINTRADFYKPVNLNQLFQSIKQSKLKKPVFC